MIKNNTEKLLKEKAGTFHSVTEKLLYIMKKFRNDLEPTVDFLCTIVTKSKEDEWQKLQRILAWVKKTIKYERVIGASSIQYIFTWVDASHPVHADMQNQTGGSMSMGWGIIHEKSGKQKLNTKSSTEVEIVGPGEYFLDNIWLIILLLEQLYSIVIFFK